MKTPIGNAITIRICPPYVIESAKQMIDSMHPLRHQLTFNGRVLEDGHTFDEYNIQYGSTLDLVVVRQGSKCTSQVYHLIVLIL